MGVLERLARVKLKKMWTTHIYYIYIYMHIICIYIHYMHIYTYIYIHIYITHTDLSIYLTYMCMHTYMYSNTNMYTIIYTYIHTYIHIHTYQKKKHLWEIGEGRGKKKLEEGKKNLEEGKKKLEEGKTNVVQYRVFGGNVGAEREELGRRARQSECTCAHQERLALLPPRLVPRIDVHAGGDDGLEQDLDCCFVLLLQRQLHARVARLNMTPWDCVEHTCTLHFRIYV